LEEQTKHFEGMVVPPMQAKPLNAHTLARDVYEKHYPNSRYLTDGYIGDETFLDSPDETYCEILSPLAESWMSDDDALPGPYSHTLLVLFNKSMHDVNGCDLAFGFDPSFEVMSYAIYDDEDMDDISLQRLKQGLDAVSKSEGTWTALAEGNIRSGKRAFRNDHWEDLSDKLRILDPGEVFKKRV
jgi:hypothetical protein